MHLSLLLFSCLFALISARSMPFLEWKGAMLYSSFFDGLNLTLIDGWKIIEDLSKFPTSRLELKKHASENRDKYNPEFEYLCRIAYCHQQAVSEISPCIRQCAQRAPKIDDKLMNARIFHINNTAPAPSKDVCKKECVDLCGKNDCGQECAYLCAVHFAFENRAKYETEVKTLFMKISTHK